MKTRFSFCSLALSVGIAALALVASAPAARAVGISYTFSGFGTGTIGETSFTNASFSFTMLGDTNNVNTNFGPNVYSNLPLPGTFNINGTTGSLTDFVYVFVNQNLSAAGFGSVLGGAPYLDMAQVLLSTYNLTSPFGPATGTVNFTTFTNVGTSAGTLNISSVTSPTFTVTGGVSPEPGTLALVAPGLLLMGAGIARRRKALVG